MNTTTNNDIQFYIDRLTYYDNLLKSEPEVEKVLGYGPIYFELDRKGIQHYYDFWLDAMIWFIETERCKGCKKCKEK